MKLYGILAAAAIILPAFASCNKEISESGPVDKIRLEPISLSTSDTKTSVHGNEIWWTLSDKIAVFSNIGNYLTPYSLSATSVKGSNAVFAGEVGEGTKDFYAIYPYSVASSAAGGLIDITVPVDQTPKAGSFGEGMNISIAKGTKTPGIPQVAGVAFHNVCSYLKFTVPSYISNVNRVDVTCDRNIAGSTTVNYANLESGSGTVTGPGTSSTVSMSGPFAPGSTFWFVLTPGKVNSLTIKLSTGDGKNWTRTSSKSFTLKIGQPKNLGIIDFVPTLQASAEHTNNKDGDLAGTEVKVDLGLPENLMKDVSNVSLKVSKDGKIVWECTSDDVSSNSIIMSDKSWPYLPQGEYTVSGTYKTGERTVPFVSAEFTSPKPEFSVNTPSAHTSYDTYYNNGNYKNADAANAEDGSTIYISNKNNGVTISDDILKIYASLIGEGGGGYSYTIDGNKAEEGDNANQTWDAHKVVARYTFDGVEMPSDTLICHVTGLPYRAPSNSKFKKNWSVKQGMNTSVNDQNMVLKSGIGSDKVPTVNCNPFHIPSEISCNIKGNYTLVSKRAVFWYTTTFKLLLNGTAFVTQQGENTNSKSYSLNKDIKLSPSANSFSATSSYILGENVYATIESFNIEYK